MRRVENHRETGAFHDWNRAHVGDEIVVAERRAALGEQDFFCARPFGFFDDLAHFRRRKELSLFQIDDLAGDGGGFNQIRLAAEKRRNLQNVHDLTHDGGVRLIVNVGQHRHAEFGADLPEHAQAFVEARPAKGFGRRAVGLVEAGFENVEDTQSGAGFLQCAGDLQAQLFVFNHARSGDQKQPARRVEIFPNGGVVEHMGVLAAARRKVNDGESPEFAVKIAPRLSQFIFFTCTCPICDSKASAITRG